MNARIWLVGWAMMGTSIVASSLASADTVDSTLDCGQLPPALQYQTLCSGEHTGDEFYHCSMSIVNNALPTLIGIKDYVVENLGPMVQEIKCTAMKDANGEIRWWDNAWVGSARPWFCWAWGAAPNACATQKGGVVPSVVYWGVCQVTLPAKVCALPNPPGPPSPRLPPPPPPVGPTP